MIIVIDGYNVLKNVSKHPFISEANRKEFIHKLTIYAHRKGHTIVIVFDGGTSTYPERTQYERVLVIFSGKFQTADDYIKQYMRTIQGQDVLLISSDRFLNKYVASYGISSLDAEVFYALLQEQEMQIRKPVKVDQKIQKLAHDTTPELDALMIEGSTKVPLKRNDANTNEINGKDKKHALSRKERTLLKKIKKL